MTKPIDLGIIGAATAVYTPAPDASEWTKEIVLDRLADGIKIVHRTAGRVGPKAFGNAMPTFLVHLDEELGKVWHESEPVRLPPSARQITLAEEACEWPTRFVEDLRVREAIQIWMMAKAIGRPWQKLAVARGWSKETAKRYKDRAVFHIVVGLQACGAPVIESRR